MGAIVFGSSEATAVLKADRTLQRLYVEAEKGSAFDKYFEEHIAKTVPHPCARSGEFYEIMKGVAMDVPRDMWAEVLRDSGVLDAAQDVDRAAWEAELTYRIAATKSPSPAVCAAT